MGLQFEKKLTPKLSIQKISRTAQEPTSRWSPLECVGKQTPYGKKG